MTTALPSLSFVIDGCPSKLRVVAVAGREALSSLFEFDLTLASDDEHLAEFHAIGEPARLHLEHGSRTRTIHGIVRTFEQGESAGPPATYRATLAPAAYVLALREDCRIFQGRRAPEIIESVLEAAGLTRRDYRLVLRGVYRPREHCVQYRETDWTFLLRLLEAEGIYCFFDHEDDREVLVFADTPSAHRKMSEPEALPFRPNGGATRDGERVDRFRHVQELRAGSVALKGHSFRTPRATLESRVESPGETERAPVGIYDAPPAFDAPEQGERLARLRLEQEVAAGGTAHATSDCLGVQPGVVFGLLEHACEPLNRDWLVKTAEHRFTAAGGLDGSASSPSYENRFTCIPSDVPFRSKTRTPKPVVGIQTAVVVGPAGQEVHCDELGRVKVQFHWDRDGHGDDKSSSWIRVSQTWAGPGYGALFIPRVGNEVLVDFADGDVDRPIVVGSVYNGVNVPPASLPEQRTTAMLRARSSPGNEGLSELRMEAETGREHVHLVACRDLGVRVGQDKDETVTRDEWLRVGGDRDRTVEGSETAMVRADRDLAVGGSHGVTIGGDETKAIGGDHGLSVGGDRSVNVTGGTTEVVGEHLVVRVGGDKKETVIGASSESVAGERAIVARSQRTDVNEDMKTSVAGDHEERAGGARRISAGEIVELVCGEATITANKDGTITLVGKQVRVKVAGKVEIEGDKLIVKSHGAVNLSADGSVKVRGRGVNLN